MLFKSILTVFSTLSMLAGGIVANMPASGEASIVRSDKYPGGTVYTLSTGLEILELFNGTFDDNLPALNMTYLLELRKADPGAVLPTIPGVPLPKPQEVNGEAPPYYGYSKCLTKDTSPNYKNSLYNGYVIRALGNAWCCAHGIYMPWGGACTIMSTSGNAKAVICKAQGDGPGAMCAPCYAAGTAILQIVAWCKVNDKAEGVVE
jgi:hypothetical protein